MVLTRAQKQDAYREARQIMKLSEKWQELMPGEKRPNFERAAQEVVRRAIGHKVERNEAPLEVHGGYMHEHGAREARLLERFLRSGTVHPDALHSFVHGRERVGAPDVAPPAQDDLNDLPDFDLYVQNFSEFHPHGLELEQPGEGHERLIALSVLLEDLSINGDGPLGIAQ